MQYIMNYYCADDWIHKSIIIYCTLCNVSGMRHRDREPNGKCINSNIIIIVILYGDVVYSVWCYNYNIYAALIVQYNTCNYRKSLACCEVMFIVYPFIVFGCLRQRQMMCAAQVRRVHLGITSPLYRSNTYNYYYYYYRIRAPQIIVLIAVVAVVLS